MKKLRPIIILLVFGVVGFLVWYFALRTPPPPKGVIQVSGRIEGDDAKVATKTSGRIREINVREGDQVKAGQIIARLEDDQIKAREEQAKAAIEQAEARVARAQQQIAVLQAQKEQSALGINQARMDAQGRVDQAEAQVSMAEANLAQAEAQQSQVEANYNQAKWDQEKYEKLAQQGDVSERTGKQAKTSLAAQEAALRASRKQVDVARRQVDSARASLTAVKANLANPAIRTAQTTAVEKQIEQAQTDVDAAKADAMRARAQLREAEANRADLNIAAPFDGTIATRAAEPGEVVSPGATIVTLVNLNQVYLRAFVPEGQIGTVRVGQRARVYLDSNPKQPLEATVSRIDPEASFTPENTYFRDDRVKQVVGVKLLLTNPQGYAKPGMPADGEIVVE
jgi:HlyD family secretion protein